MEKNKLDEIGEILKRLTEIERRRDSDPTRFQRFMDAHAPKPRPTLWQELKQITHKWVFGR